MMSTRAGMIACVLAGLGLALGTGGATAQSKAAQPTHEEIARGVAREYPSLEELYQHFHTHPELSFSEEKSAERLASEFRRIGFEVTEQVGGTGVVAVLVNGEGPTVLVRADMDALPVVEETGLDYASRVKVREASGLEVGVMHACGHDIHMTSLIGTARLLSAMKQRWRGTLVMIGQPAEERGAGAKAMLEDGLFDRFPYPDFCLGLHVDSVLAAGRVGIVPGYAMANVDSVDIHVRGRGGHGAYPHATKDPIVVAALIVVALQTIVSREVAPTAPAVVTVGSFHGGAKHNVIPDDVRLQLTVRSYTDEVRDQVLAAIERVSRGIAQAAGIPEELAPIVTFGDTYTPATYNDPQLAERVRGVLVRFLGEANVAGGEPTMGGEDFGRYGRTTPRIPIFMFRLGSISPVRIEESRREGGRPLPSLHSSLYFPEPEPTIRTGVGAMTAAVLDLMGERP